MKEIITKEQAIGMYRDKYKLAEALGITRQAIDFWPEGKPIPEVHALKIRYVLRPELFESNKRAKG
jgi:DNA-binding XRE family transcriptional regulator